VGEKIGKLKRTWIGYANRRAVLLLLKKRRGVLKREKGEIPSALPQGAK